ncbi:hypothetical protein PHYBOEH_008268 [Phytophthora boehmeriae]|uniref:RxLR effector protein n=1 Tax=Phytophthora boehmeriae TaxID=109152 RepID=A0A8T1W162_9STRA|nr:hypothetical protein PHYBOEH_008268 [Phytophthora boehmeriae]
MRLLCYVLLLIAIIFATTTTAKSQGQQELSELTPSDLDALARFLVNGDDTRRLRDVAATDVSPDDEERAIKLPSSISKLFAGVSSQMTKAKEALLNRAFQHLEKGGYNPTKLAKTLRIDKKNTPKRNLKLYEKFTVYWMKKHDLVNAAT